MTSFFLDTDNAGLIFDLLFTFLHDDAWDRESETFESTLYDIVQGVKLPDDALKRVRGIYHDVQDKPSDLMELGKRVQAQFTDDRTVVMALAHILLRLTVDDGIICQRLGERLSLLLPYFNLNLDELSHFSDEQNNIIDYLNLEYSNFETGKRKIRDLDRQYSILGCNSKSTDEELRRSYRKLVKEYHPDVHESADLSDSDMQNKRKHFEEVQHAFASICKRRLL